MVQQRNGAVSGVGSLTARVDVQMLFVLDQTVWQTRARRIDRSLEQVRAEGGFAAPPMTRLPEPRLSFDDLIS